MPLSVPHTARTVVSLLAVAVALSGVPASTPAQAIPVEGYPVYQPQTTCTPSPKKGTLKLADYLMKAYPGSGSSGISRSCTASGSSEHKEGRAFDWQLNATRSRDRGYARDFLNRLLATDSEGNANALARRMGIMYVIWNDSIWSASRSYRKRPYLHRACKQKTGCSATLRHRDHMHISLSWAGARGTTSWYAGSAADEAPTPTPTAGPTTKPTAKPTTRPTTKPTTRPTAKPTPTPPPVTVVPAGRAPRYSDGTIDLRRAPLTRIDVPANGKVVTTRFKLAKGVTYSLTATGLYSFGGPDAAADAVCTWNPAEQRWGSAPARSVRRKHGRLALLVNGRRIFGDTCTSSHTYRTSFTSPRSAVLRVKVLGRHTDSRGKLSLVVSRPRTKIAPALPTYPTLTPAPTYSTNPLSGPGLISETVTVPANRSGATYTAGSLTAGAAYRVTVSGLVTIASGVRSNGQCVSVRGTWYDAASIDLRVPGQDHGNLYLDGEPFDGTSANGCGSNEHVAEVKAGSTGRLRLDLWDPLTVSDNSGELTVKVQRLTPVPTPAPAPREPVRRFRQEWKQVRDVFTVDARSATGTVSTLRLRKGERAQVVVSGRFTSGSQSADASCVQTSSGWTRTLPDLLVQDTLDVWVDGRAVRWWPRPAAAGGCSGAARYTTTIAATKPGPLRISVFDLDHTDNSGRLSVIVRRLKG